MFNRLLAASSSFRVLASRTFEILRTREQSVFLALDEGTVLAAESRVLLLTHFVERLAQVPQDMKLVEQDGCLRACFAVELRKGFHMSITPSAPFGQVSPPKKR